MLNLPKFWPVPLSDLINFVAFLEKSGYKASTAKSYISGLSFKMKMLGMSDTTKSFIISKMLHGMEKLHKRVDARKPITFEILEKIITALPNVCSSNYESTLFASTFSIAFFGFLRVGEFALSTNSERHMLQIQDVSFDIDRHQIILRLPSSKTDQFAASTNLTIDACSNSAICPVNKLINYLKLRPKVVGALFCHLNRTPLTRFQVSSILKSALNFVHLNANDFNTHSFRIGAATSFAIQGKSDEQIKKLGRWKSSAFNKYIRL